MKTKTIFRIASLGLLLTSIFLLDYSNLTLESNGNIYIMLLGAILLWFIPTFLSPMKNLKRSIIYLNILIVFLIIFALINLVLIFMNPSNIQPYGRVFVSICFIASYLIIRKTNKKKLQGN